MELRALSTTQEAFCTSQEQILKNKSNPLLHIRGTSVVLLPKVGVNGGKPHSDYTIALLSTCSQCGSLQEGRGMHMYLGCRIQSCTSQILASSASQGIM